MKATNYRKLTEHLSSAPLSYMLPCHWNILNFNILQIRTKSAMTGKIEFREALAKRLQIISPTMSQMRDFIKMHPLRLTKNIRYLYISKNLLLVIYWLYSKLGRHTTFSICRELVHRLQEKSVPVYLVSGGFRGIIGPIALELNIPLQNIYANKLKFFFNGN